MKPLKIAKQITNCEMQSPDTYVQKIGNEPEMISGDFGLQGNHRMTLNDIGTRFDLTRGRVKQIKQNATGICKTSPRADRCVLTRSRSPLQTNPFQWTS